MCDLKTFLARVLLSGLSASVATTATVAACGEVEESNALGSLNAVSHILWGDEAAEQDQATLKYTATGIALNSLAVTSWAVVHEMIAEKELNQRSVGSALVDGAIVAGLAFITDYYIVPKRLTPGFEKRLSNKSLLAIYSALAISLGVSSLCQPK